MDDALMRRMQELAIEEEQALEAKAQHTTDKPLAELGQEALALIEEKDRLEARLKEVNGQLRFLREEAIPARMIQAGLAVGGRGKANLNGARIHLEVRTYGNITKRDLPTFITWCRAQGRTPWDYLKVEGDPKKLKDLIIERRQQGQADPPGVSLHEPVKAVLTRTTKATQ